MDISKSLPWRYSRKISGFNILPQITDANGNNVTITFLTAPLIVKAVNRYAKTKNMIKQDNYIAMDQAYKDIYSSLVNYVPEGVSDDDFNLMAEEIRNIVCDLVMSVQNK